ncbi:MAG: tetratricopeptide repeat protein [Sandaracinaceae bacterium]|nr:tetratricopeptide repeat protein [Sandaracinaceae bacterium]
MISRTFGCLLLALAIGCGSAPRRAAGAPPDPLDSISAEELFQRGVMLGQGGDYVRAEQYIVAAIDRGFPEEQAMPALMHACVASSRLSAALTYAEPYLSRHPGQWPLRLLVASIHMGLEEPDRARAELERVLRDAPADQEPPEAHYFLGVLHRDGGGDVETAREHFRRYLALAPDGRHRDEALGALPPEESGLPRRIESGEGAGAPVRVEAEDAPPGGSP